MLKTIGNQFKRPSGFLGKIISLLMKRGNNSTYDTLLPILDIKDQDNIFEIGYGHGMGIEKILSKNNCSISGIDFSELMYNEATNRNKKHIEQNNVKLYFGDFLSFDFGELRFDKIFCINVIYFWNNLEKPFSSIRTGLNDNGIFCFYMAHPDELNKLKFTKDDIFNKYSIEYVLDKLNLAGFSKIDYHIKKGYFIKCEK